MNKNTCSTCSYRAYSLVWEQDIKQMTALKCRVCYEGGMPGTVRIYLRFSSWICYSVSHPQLSIDCKSPGKRIIPLEHTVVSKPAQGRLGASVGWASDSWFQLGSWSHGSWVWAPGPVHTDSTGLLGILSLPFSLPFLCLCIHSHSLE